MNSVPETIPDSAASAPETLSAGTNAMSSLSRPETLDFDVNAGTVALTDATFPLLVIAISKKTIPPPFSLSCTTA